MRDVLVAGHICLDVIPSLHQPLSVEPGKLVEVGPAVVSTGGAVSNVGIGLHRLGATVSLVGKIGEDHLGQTVRAILEAEGSGLSNGLVVSKEDTTSYTVVLSTKGLDRMFLHHPGCNDTFSDADVPAEAMQSARFFHFGYPPLMAAMVVDRGEPLRRLMQRAKESGCVTSLDMSLPDPNGPMGTVNWQGLLKKVLPYVDHFVPSEDELAFMLPDARGSESMAERCLEYGAGQVLLKKGSKGLSFFVRSEKFDLPTYPVDVAGTTGAGDATIAGYLYGRVLGLSTENCLRAGLAVGASACQAVDATSGIPSWKRVTERFGLADG